MKRCEWAVSNALEEEYHDHEWGVPVHDDRHLFEMLILEGAQAGLSWDCILKKRPEYQKAFDNFDVEKVARYSEGKIAQLLSNPGIVRNRRKVSAAVKNAQCFIEVQKEYGSFDTYIWSFVQGKPLQNNWKTPSDVPCSTTESTAMSKSLKKRGFSFVGPTICYAFMQATGMVNDHVVSCFRHRQLKNL